MYYKIFIVVCLALICVSCSTDKKINEFDKVDGDNRLPEIEEKRGFQLLSGDDALEHWVIMGNPEGWSFQNGIIRSEGGKGGQWLRSKKQYSDFVLRLDYKVAPGGNSGVFFRCEKEGQPWVTGHECQISNEQPPRDDLHCTGTLYGNVPANPRPDESPNVWHSMEILCQNQRIIVQIDRRQTVDVNMAEIEAIQDKPLQGFIGLQDSHTQEGYWVEFRNVRIRQLPKKPD